MRKQLSLHLNVTINGVNRPQIKLWYVNGFNATDMINLFLLLTLTVDDFFIEWQSSNGSYSDEHKQWQKQFSFHNKHMHAQICFIVVLKKP